MVWLDQLHEIRGGRVDNLRRFGDFGNRDSAQFRVFFNHVFTLRKIGAESLVACNITMLPLYGIADRRKCLIGCAGRAADLCRRKTSDTRYIAFDDVSFHGAHGMSFLLNVYLHNAQVGVDRITQFSLP